MWTDATRYLSKVSGAVNATTVSGTPAQENATFAEVFPLLDSNPSPPAGNAIRIPGSLAAARL